MPNPAFIVEGRMEQLIARRICPGQPVTKIGCNGNSAPIEVVAKFIAAQIRVLNNRYYPIIIVFDREDRDMSCDKIKNDLLNILHDSYNFSDQDIRIFIADRMTEDLYLADIESIVRHYNLPPYADQLFQGKGGLSRLLNSHMQYHETTLGVEIFFVVNHRRVADTYPHWSDFLETVEELICPSFPRLQI